MVLHAFHPTVRKWFEQRLGTPSAPQRDGWPRIQRGQHTLIAAPTGSGKTLAAFLSAIDGLLRIGPDLPDETRVLYVSPLRALGNDVQKNLTAPLAEIRGMDPLLPEVRVLVRTGDTKASERAAMTKKPPHILVTTPESLYILLTSEGGRGMLKTVRSVIVDEIHAVARDKRGSHLALSLERLDALAGPVQRIGLSATQKPLDEVGRFLVGGGRECALVDAGHRRELDLAVEVPASPLSAVCSHEVWEEIYERIAALIREHKTTLVFVNTRKMAERIAARLASRLGEDQVACHHGSLAKARRLDAEERLKTGKLKALVATASLELGIDIGDVDLTVLVGATRSIATFLQRVGRAGHGLDRIPKGRVFPLTLDELAEAAAILRSIRQGILDRTINPPGALDILAQQVVAACVPDAWGEDELYERFRRAWPYRDLERADFDAVVALHSDGRHALLHRDGVNRRLRATKRARITAITSGGAIPDTADYQVVLEPEGTVVGTLNEDFAIESNGGDVFQLGTASWQVLRVEPGIVRVADAKGAPPTIPFWLGEAPSRTAELAAEVGSIREIASDAGAVMRETGMEEAAARQLADYVAEGTKALGAVPTTSHLVLERFFDESGGMQLVVHAPFGSRVNRAFGLALRKRFCRSFGFELQAAANEEAIVLSLATQHSFPLEEVFGYLHPNTARDVLIQALLAAPMFETRWRWNVSRALLMPRTKNGKRVPTPLQRMRAGDLLAAAFPQVAACAETLPGGDLPVPLEHPIVKQTIEDCLHEAMDVDGFLAVLRRIRDGSLKCTAVDTPTPSPFAYGILNAMPYAFLDDAPLEERRTQAVITRRVLDAKSADEIGALDPAAVARVREEAWPSPENAEEVHEALSWMGYVAEDEAARGSPTERSEGWGGGPWRAWLDELRSARRVELVDGRWFAAEAPRDEKTVLRRRLEALGPVFSDDPLLLELEREGSVLRARIEGREAWCDRRLLARIHRYTLERLRREIEPVTAAQFLRFLASWQHADPESRLDGPRGVADVVAQLAGFEVPAAAWEASVLPMRVRGYRRDWLDQLVLSGEVTWARLWGAGATPIRTTPICLLRREDLDSWTGLSQRPQVRELGAAASVLLEALTARGAMFHQDLARATKLLPVELEGGLGELIAQGLVTCDSFAALRWLIVPPSRRRTPLSSMGRFALARHRENGPAGAGGPGALAEPPVEFIARQLLRRTGVVFRRTIQREKQPVPWRDLVRCYRTLEARGEVRGGRFVAGFDGEQYALPEAVTVLRAVRKREPGPPLSVSASDPLNFRGILTPDERVAPTARARVLVG